MNRRFNTPAVAAEQSLDATFQSVEKAIGADPDFLWMPCQGAYEDYRYSACYLDDNKNLFDSFRSLMSRLEAVGFQGAPRPTSDTELAAILTKRSPSTRLRVTYLGTVVEVVMEQPGIGMVQSTDNSENAPAGMNTYVRKDARAMAKQVYYNLMIRSPYDTVTDKISYPGLQARMVYQEGGSPDLKVTVRALQEPPG